MILFLDTTRHETTRNDAHTCLMAVAARFDWHRRRSNPSWPNPIPSSREAPPTISVSLYRFSLQRAYPPKTQNIFSFRDTCRRWHVPVALPSIPCAWIFCSVPNRLPWRPLRRFRRPRAPWRSWRAVPAFRTFLDPKNTHLSQRRPIRDSRYRTADYYC